MAIIDIDYSSRISALRSVGQAIGVPSNLLPDKNASISNIECLRWINIIRQAKSFPLLPGLDYNGFVGAINDIVILAGGGSTDMGRPLITADTAYYVTVGGNDTSGDGSQAKPWLTIQTAFNYFMSVDFNGHSLTLNIGPGTFLGGYCSYLTGGGYLNIFGDSSATTTIMIPSTYSVCFSFNYTGSTQIAFGNVTVLAGRYGGINATTVFINLNNYYVVDGNYFTSDLIFSTVNQPQTLMRFSQCTIFSQGTIEIQQHGGSLSEIINLSQSTFDDFSYSDPWVLSGTPDTVSQFVMMSRFSYFDLSYTAGFTGSQFIGRKFFIDHGSFIYSGHYNFNVLPGTLPGLWNSSCFYDRLPGPISADNGVGLSSTGSFLPTLSHARYVLNKINGGGADFIGATNGSVRWMGIFGNATNEAGANVGSDFDLTPYDDTGVALPNALRVTRSTGVVNFAVHPTVAGVPLLAELTDMINKLSAKVAALEAKGKK